MAKLFPWIAVALATLWFIAACVFALQPHEGEDE